MANPDTIALSPYYYRDNFLRLCDTVQSQYGDILTAAEQDLLGRIHALPFNAQCLYVRLVSRAGPWFREGKLTYPELGDITPIVDQLIQGQMAAVADELPLEILGKLYTRQELLLSFSTQLSTAQFPSKTALLCAIDALAPNTPALLQALRRSYPERLIAPLGMELVNNLQVLFFGNRHQSLTEFVLEDLGVTRYFSYTLDRSVRLFPRREALEEYLTCAALADEHRKRVESGDTDELPALAAQVLALTVQYPSSESRWHRLCNRLARDLERQEQWSVALELYQRSALHPARERRARILERCGNWPDADALCTQILQDPWCEGEREAAARIRPRVRRKLGGGAQPRTRDAFDNIKLHLPATGEAVERQVAAHLLAQWHAVHFVENSLMNALFGLAFWEQIFAALPGVFHNPFQSAPADMYERSFRTRREDAITARMEELRAANLNEVLCAAYQRYQPCQCHWVNWRYIDVALVDAATRIMPRQHLLAIWERMLFDPQENRRGFPDLLALGERAGEYCMIEVKGPGDALQDSQKRWLRFFQGQQIPAQVAWVEWAT